MLACEELRLVGHYQQVHLAIVALPPGAHLSLPDTVGHPGQELVLPLHIQDNDGGLLAAEVAA